MIAGADGAPVVIAAGGFAQPSDAGAAMLARRVDELSRAGKERARHVVELFAGSGTLSVLLARGAASYAAVELDEAACAAARENLAARGASVVGARVIPADADAYAIPPSTTVVVLDPPRTGAAGAARAIAASGARVVVYVACDPPTLARDLGAMTRGRLAITDIETFELFPQTSHVETVVRLERGPLHLLQGAPSSRADRPRARMQTSALEDGGRLRQEQRRPRHDGGPLLQVQRRLRQDGGRLLQEQRRLRQDGGQLRQEQRRLRQDGGQLRQAQRRLRQDGSGQLLQAQRRIAPGRRAAAPVRNRRLRQDGGQLLQEQWRLREDGGHSRPRRNDDCARTERRRF